MCCGDACLRKAPGLLHGLGLHDEKLIFLLSPFTDSLITLKKESIGISTIFCCGRNASFCEIPHFIHDV